MSDQVDRPTPAHDLFRHIVQHGPVAILALDERGHIVLASREAVRLLDWDPTGRRFLDVFDDVDRLAGEACLEGLSPASAGAPETFTAELRHAAGAGRVVEVSGRWLPTAPGGPVAVIALVDVTEADPSARRVPPLGSNLDRLTGLPNRRWLFEQLDRACESGGAGSVAFIDLDRFGALNRRLGRDGGDRLLRVAARRLADNLPAGVFVGRIGGDEFVAVFPDDPPAVAVRHVEAALQALQEPIDVAAGSLTLTASAGVASLGPRDSGLVLRQADAAMYEAKKSGPGHVAVYGPHVALWAENLWTLAANVARLEQDRVRLEVEARTDVLTGLPNVRALTEALQALTGPDATEHQPVSVLFVDLDRFGLYNKRQGDSSGDVALRLVAGAVSAACREGDTAYRKGGEELVLLLPRTAHADALAIGERLRTAVEELQIPHGGHPDTPILTVTIGVATAEPGDTVVGVQASAAAAAFQAKLAERRNRTVSAHH